MTVIAPLNYERYTVVLSPLLMPLETSGFSRSGLREPQTVTPKRTNFDLPGQQPFGVKTKQPRSAFVTNALPPPLQPGPLTSSGPASQLNASAFLANLQINRQSSLSPGDVARLYDVTRTSVKYTLNIKG